MIEVINFQGLKEFVNPSAIVRITPASASSQWHGIKAIIKLFDGSVIESHNTVEEIRQKMLEAEK